jgi:outer membrane receptor for ferric coprogen and ferric-rhodotorulic acid
VAYRLDDRWQMALNLNNLTGRVYYQTVGEPEEDNYYGAPRSFTLSLRGTF